MFKRETSWLAGASVLSLGLAGFTPAHSAEVDKTATLEELVVTATKREESLQKVPLSITAVTGEQLQARGVESFADLARLVPGVVQSGTSQFSKFTVRGIQTSNTTSSSGEQKAVAVYLDDLPLTSFSIITPELSPYDMSRIEVLRGPQGTLFGSGTIAGAVRYITNKPDSRAFDASVGADLGVTKGDSYRRRISGMVNVPIIDGKLAVRAVAYDRDEDGYIFNVVRNEKHPDSTKARGIRVSAKLDPTDDISVTAMITDDHNKIGDISRYNPAFGLNVANSRWPNTVDAEVKTYSLSGSYSLPFATIQSSTTFARVNTAFDLDLNSVTSIPYRFNEAIDTDSVTEDFRLVSSGEHRLEYIVGVFYLNQKSDYTDTHYTDAALVRSRNITGLGSNGGFADINKLDIRQKKNMEAALYGEATLHITDTVRATVGLRQSRFKFSDADTGLGFDGQANFIGAVAAGGNRAVVLVPATPSIISTGYQTKLTKKFNVSWQRTPSQNYYVLAAEGFRRGHPNFTALRNNGKSAVDPTDPTIIPLSAASDSLWNYEVGAKTLWFDGRLRVNVAAYYIPWGPMQVNLVRPSDSAPFVGNAGKSTSKGVEVELEARPTPSIDIGANITLQRARISSLTTLEALTTGAVPGAPLASPDFQLYAYAQKTWELANGASVFSRVDVQHVGSFPNGFPNAPGRTASSTNYFIVPSYDNVNVSAGWESGQIRITAYGENIANKSWNININASGSSTNRYLTLRPRTLGVRLDWKY